MGWSIEKYVYIYMYCVMLWVTELHVIQHRIFLYTRSVCPVTGIVFNFGSFHVTVGSVPLAVNPVYRESGSTRFGSMHCS